MNRRWTAGVLFEGIVVLLLLNGAVRAATEDAPPLDERLERSVVRVAYTLRYDKGEPPSGGWTFHCAACGSAHVIDLEQLIDEERPLEQAGFLVGPTRVVTADNLISPRFIDRIEVIGGDQQVIATPAGVAGDDGAVFLKLSEPLGGGVPLAFDSAAEGPYFTVTCSQHEGQWTMVIAPMKLVPVRRLGGEPFLSVPSPSLIVSATGRPVALALRSELPAGAWKVPPDAWSIDTQAELEQRLARLEQRSDEQIVRVSLSFRSPKGDEERRMSGFFGSHGDDMATERTVAGVRLGGERVLVLAELEPKVTARLERMRVHLPDGRAVEGRFAGTLSDYGCFLIELEEPAPLPAAPRPDTLLDYRDRLLLGAEVRIQGENRVAYLERSRIAAFELGWRDRLFPVTSSDPSNLFLFDERGTLVALPLARRRTVDGDERWARRFPGLTPMEQVWAALDDLQPNLDRNNVPLPESQENRLAWLGVELQPLQRELARMNNISDQTKDGETGALVIYVYPQSPAALAGLEVGDILLRMQIERWPRPLEVRVDEDPFGFGGAYPWDRWDELPEEYFDQVPPPWPPAESRLNRQLTDLGFGTRFTVEFARDGRIETRDLEVLEGPAHYEAAPRYRSEELGLTVRDLTYEVRRYFQIDAGEPGVILSRIEPGSKAAVAGLRPIRDHPECR